MDVYIILFLKILNKLLIILYKFIYILLNNYLNPIFWKKLSRIIDYYLLLFFKFCIKKTI